MVRVCIVMREAGNLQPDYSLEFDLPEVPHPGDYVSILRPDAAPHSEDGIVQQVWWRLAHPEVGTVATEPRKIGTAMEIVVECSPAIGPTSTDRWRDLLEPNRKRGEAKEFQLARLSVRQDAIKPQK